MFDMMLLIFATSDGANASNETSYTPRSLIPHPLFYFFHVNSNTNIIVLGLERLQA